ncbi:pyridoxamine 5'-phosphate oxidase [Marinihelvus fidelis]|uniref:Pyridoxine/pyridoxamine 5'-phosphate oxidase n=1 Tax=Marinihelvus fidelis TaxID=2613842 RepID=A0A5N0T402_9GAMM|nr:pyridoxamine 5'-phosphate oxidase [Marinihelvus fidelis]
MALPDEAVERFREGLDEAIAAGEVEPTAMCLSTLGVDGGLSSRMVLMKAFTPEGFVFYTNLESRKGTQLAASGAAALVFHWKATERQVRVEGVAEPVSDADADAYFASRPRGSQLGAWASDQSRPMASRVTLVKRVAAVEARYLGRPVPRPPHWSGFLVRPRLVEFWYGRRSRLHDRFVFTLDNGEWRRERQFP